MKNEIKNVYEKILELNLHINSILNDFPSDDFENFNKDLTESLGQKEECIQKLISLKASSENEFNEIREKELKEISAQINDFEQKNLKLIEDKKIYLSEQINKTNKAAKVFSAYKFNKQTEPRIFDDRD